MRLPAQVCLLVALCVCPAVARAAQDVNGAVPTVSTVVHLQADSLFQRILTRLKNGGYQLDQTDAGKRRLVVRPPGQSTRVEVRLIPNGDSTAVAIAPIDVPGIAGMQATLLVTHDATLGVENDGRVIRTLPGELPPSQWRPELFLSPRGRFWVARGGLYVADSLPGPWRRVFGNTNDPMEVSHDVLMGFADDSTAFLGFPGIGIDEDSAHLLRTADAGGSWTPVRIADLAWVDDIGAIGRSVWVLGTRWEKQERRGLFVSSGDAGQTWARLPLPAQLNDVTVLYRQSVKTAYVATSRSKNDPVFWRTADGGATWTPIPTPHDKGLHKVPSYGVRVEEIATIGNWLVVREYGKVFATRADSIRWRRLDGVGSIAADRERDQLFVLTDSGYAEMLDRDLNVLWKTADRVPDNPPGEPTNIEKVLARSGKGFVSMSFGEIYEASDGVLRLVQRKPND
jgi:photosystem II stability/assembly factor-like uncharacterized protein